MVDLSWIDTRLALEVFGLGLILFGLFQAKKALDAQTYLAMLNSLNTHENADEILALKSAINANGVDPLDSSSWPDEVTRLARAITNRYEVVCHMVERKLLNKGMYLEAFSVTVLDVWNMCSPYIALCTANLQNVVYYRRDLEVMALYAWLYLESEGIDVQLMLMNREANLSIIDSSSSKNRSLVEERISLIRRPSLFRRG